jgi:hypothetical protein
METLAANQTASSRFPRSNHPSPDGTVCCIANRAPRRVRSQATAQNHQGPQGSEEPRALALLPRRANRPNSRLYQQ